MRDAMKVPFYFGGTSLLIVVVVIMDFMAQVQTLMMSSQYESALKKANLKGYGRYLVAREVTESKNESSCFRQEIMP